MRSVVRPCFAAAMLPLVVIPVQVATAGAAAAAATRVEALVVDDQHRRVFRSRDTGVVRADIKGRFEVPIAGLEGSAGMAMSADRTRVWVALPERHLVAAIDVSDLTVQTWAVGEGICPTSVAESAGSVWFSTSCADSAGVAVLDPSNGSVEVLLDDAVDPLVRSVPGEGDSVLVIERDSDPGVVRLYDAVGGADPSLTALAQIPAETGQVRDVDVSADGQLVAVVANAPDELRLYRSGDLHKVGSRPMPGARQVATRSDGLIGVADSGRRLHVFAPGYSRPRTYQFPMWAPPEELVFGARDAYASARIDAIGVVTPQFPATLKLTAPGEQFAVAGEPRRFVVALRTDSPNRRVRLYVSESGTPRRYVRTVVVPPGESVKTDLTLRQNAVVEAVYDGDRFTRPVTSRVKLFIRAALKVRMVGYRKQVGRVYRYHVSDTNLTKVTMRPASTGKCIVFTLQQRRPRMWQDIASTGCVRSSSTGKAAARLPGDPALVGRELRIEVSTKSDSSSLKNTVHRYLEFVR